MHSLKCRSNIFNLLFRSCYLSLENLVRNMIFSPLYYRFFAVFSTILLLMLTSSAELSTYDDGKNTSTFNQNTFSGHIDHIFSPFDPPPGWTQFSKVLSYSFYHATPVHLNNSIYLVGGCVTPLCRETDNSLATSVYHTEIYGINIHTPMFFSANKYPRLPGAELQGSNLTYVRVAGPHSTVNLGSSSLYITASCTLMFPQKLNLDNMDDSEWDAMIGEYALVWRLSPDNNNAFYSGQKLYSTSADVFITLPRNRVRVNASCVSVGNMVYIVGGSFLTPASNVREGKFVPTKDIDCFDVATKQFFAKVEKLREAVLHPSVSASTAGFVVAGGLKVAGDEYGTLEPSRLISLIFPASNMQRFGYKSTVRGEESYNCAVAIEKTLSAKEHQIFFPTNITEIEKRYILHGADNCRVSLFSGNLVIANHNSSYITVVDLSHSGMKKIFLNEFGVRQSADDNGYVVSYAPVTTMLSKVTFFDNETFSTLTLFKLSGTDVLHECATSAMDDNSDSKTTCLDEVFRSTRVLYRSFVEIDQRAIFLPSPQIENDDNFDINNHSYDNFISFNMSPRSFRSLCTRYAESSGAWNANVEKKCLVRLSSRRDCVGNAAGTLDALYGGETSEKVSFVASGDSNPVYVCVGVPSKDDLVNYNHKDMFHNDYYCESRIFFTNVDTLLYSLRIEAGDSPPTPKPTPPTESPTKPPSPIESNTWLLFGFIGSFLLCSLVILRCTNKREDALSGRNNGRFNRVIGHLEATHPLSTSNRTCNNNSLDLTMTDNSNVRKNAMLFLNESKRLQEKNSIVESFNKDDVEGSAKAVNFFLAKEVVFLKQSKYKIHGVVADSMYSLIFHVSRFCDDPQKPTTPLALKYLNCPSEKIRAKIARKLDRLKNLKQYQPYLSVPQDMFINYNPVVFFNSSNEEEEEEEEDVDRQGSAQFSIYDEDQGDSVSSVAGVNDVQCLQKVSDQRWSKIELKRRIEMFFKISSSSFIVELLPDDKNPQWDCCYVSRLYKHRNIMQFLYPPSPRDNLTAPRVSQTKPKISEPQLCSILYQACSQLSSLLIQRPPIFHGNIKAENVLVRDFFRSKKNEDVVPVTSNIGSYIPVVFSDVGMSFWLEWNLLFRLEQYSNHRMGLELPKNEHKKNSEHNRRCKREAHSIGEENRPSSECGRESEKRVGRKNVVNDDEFCGTMKDSREAFLASEDGRRFLEERSPSDLQRFLANVLNVPNRFPPERILMSLIRIPSLTEVFFIYIEYLLRFNIVPVTVPLKRCFLSRHLARMHQGPSDKNGPGSSWLSERCLRPNRGRVTPLLADYESKVNNESESCSKENEKENKDVADTQASTLPLPNLSTMPLTGFRPAPQIPFASNTVTEASPSPSRKVSSTFKDDIQHINKKNHRHGNVVSSTLRESRQLLDDISDQGAGFMRTENGLLNMSATMNHYSDFFSVPSPATSFVDQNDSGTSNNENKSYVHSTASESTCITGTTDSAASTETLLLILSIYDKDFRVDDLWALGVLLYELIFPDKVSSIQEALPTNAALSKGTSQQMDSKPFDLSTRALEALIADINSVLFPSTDESINRPVGKEQNWENCTAFQQEIFHKIIETGIYTAEVANLVSLLLSPLGCRRPTVHQILSALRLREKIENTLTESDKSLQPEEAVLFDEKNAIIYLQKNAKF